MAAKLYTFPKNPRAAKILIAAHYSGAQIEVIDNPAQFKYGTTNKSAEFVAQFPFGKVPAFVTAEGKPIYESNAIAAFVASFNNALVPADHYEAALVQQYVSVSDAEVYPAAATLVYPLLGALPYNKASGDKAKAALHQVLAVLDKDLATRTFLVGERVTLADITLVTDLLQLFEHVIEPSFRASFPHVVRWFTTCVNQPQFKAVLGSVKLAEKAPVYEGAAAGGKKEKGEPKEEKKKEEKKAEPKKEEPKKEEKKKEEKKKAEEEEAGGEDDFMSEEEKKPNDPLALLPKSPFDFDAFKRSYSNEDTPVAIEHFWKNLDKLGYSIWKCDYNYNNELTKVFMTCNLVSGFFQRIEKLRKYAFGSMCVFGEDGNNKIAGVWVWKGQELVFPLSDDWNVDAPSYTWRKLDADSAETKTLVKEYFSWEGAFADQGLPFNQGKIFK